MLLDSFKNKNSRAHTHTPSEAAVPAQHPPYGIFRSAIEIKIQLKLWIKYSFPDKCKFLYVFSSFCEFKMK